MQIESNRQVLESELKAIEREQLEQQQLEIDLMAQ